MGVAWRKKGVKFDYQDFSHAETKPSKNRECLPAQVMDVSSR